MNQRTSGAANEAGRVRPYHKDAEYSYTLGGFPTLELLESRPESVKTVILHSRCTDAEKITAHCRSAGIMIETDDKQIARLSGKGNCFAIGVFQKYETALDPGRPHVALAHPGDMGNLGTIVRTLVGFGIYDLALISPCADIFHPKTVRASMGSLFRLRFSHFTSFDEYVQKFPGRDIYPFMTDGGNTISIKTENNNEKYTLVFGNESSGLDRSFASVGTPVRIPQTEDVDSLNLPIAVGIGVFAFTAGRAEAGDK